MAQIHLHVPSFNAGELSPLLGAADNAAMRTDLGLGTLATQNGTFSGTKFINCIADTNVGWGFTASAVKDGCMLLNCAARNNNTGGGTGDINKTNLTYAVVTVTLSGDPFTASSSGDFSLNNTASAGAACRAAGIPGVYAAGTSTGYLDIGAVQHADPVAAGGETTSCFG